MKDNRSYISKKYAALKRYYMWYCVSKKLDLILVSEFPKSGGTWYCQMLSDYLQLPYPRNRTPRLEKSVLHGHPLYSPHFNKIVCVIRDGRDVLVSCYHHMYFGNSIMQSSTVQHYRVRAPFKNFENIKENMPAHIEYMFTKFTLGIEKINWSSFVQSYINKKNVVFVKYENLLSNAEKEMTGSIITLLDDSHIIDSQRLQKVIQNNSFENLSKRKKGEENKTEFLRKGIAGDWKIYFSKEACQLFDYFGGNELMNLGYEFNHDWYNNVQ